MAEKHSVFDLGGFDCAPSSQLVSVSTACQIISRSRSSIYRQFLSGELTQIKIGGSTRVRIGDLRSLIAKCEV